MKHHRHITCLLFVAMLATFASGQAAGSAYRGIAEPPSGLSVGTSDHFIHVMQTNEKYAEIGNSPMTPGVSYHGGPVVITPNLYVIFWNPPTLQDGTPISMSTKFLNTVNGMLAGYEGHGLGNNLTQYYSIVTSCKGICLTTQYNVLNTGKYAASYMDASPYPAAGWGCQQFHIGNCVSDDQVQAEITKVMGLQGWSAGLNNIFLLFTSIGETICTNESQPRCDFVNICAYHGQWPTASSNVLYAPLPYMDPTFAPHCQVANPPNDAAGDSTANAASHEIAETITNPLGTGWFGDGGEVGDLCGSNMGTNAWDNGLANQYWSEVQRLIPRPISPIPVYFELQMIWDQNTQSCVQVGP